MLRTADDAVRSRKESLQLSDVTIDEIAGLAAGHTNKVIGPARDKTLTLMALVGAMGLAFVLVDDPDSRVSQR